MPIGTWKTPNFDFDVNNPDASSVKINIENCFDVAQRIANCFAVHEQASPNMTLRVEAGFIFNTSGTLTEYAAQNTSTITAPTTNPRIDRVVLNPFTGAVSIITGTEAVSPTAPAITAGTRPLARVSLSVGQTTITNTNITDERAFNFFILGTITAPTSAGLLIEASNGTDVGLLGVGNSANVTWYGGHTMTTLTASTSLTTPLILDSNGNEQIQFVTTTSAVNHFQITNRGTGLAPIFAAVGDDTNININFLTKGTGTYVFNGTSTSQAKISIREQTTNGNNGIILQTAAAVTSDKTWTLPEGDVANGVWVSNGSGVLTTQRPCFAEGFFDGTAGSPSFAYDYNFGTITDNGNGDYTLNFTASASSANYIALGCATTAAGQENDNIIIQSKATGSVRINNRDIGANAFQDNSGINVFVSFPF